jgi:uncharacterized protein (DUF342 family)
VKRAVQRLTALRLELIHELRQVYEAEVVVRETVYPGVVVRFGEERFVPDQEQGGVRLRYDPYLRKIQVRGVNAREKNAREKARQPDR